MTPLFALSLLLLGPTAEADQFENAGFAVMSRASENAVAELEQLHQSEPDDPAIMLNLAAAYIEAGRPADAREMYTAAIASRERMELELADGGWADSRTLARQGLARLERSAAWASR